MKKKTAKMEVKKKNLQKLVYAKEGKVQFDKKRCRILSHRKMH